MSAPAALSAAEAGDRLDDTRLDLTLAGHLLHLIEVIAADDMSQTGDAAEFLRQKNEITALARAVARTIATSEETIEAVREVLPTGPSPALKGARHAA